MQDYNRYDNVQDTGRLRRALSMIANRVLQNRVELQRQLSALGGAPPPAEPYEIPESEDPAALQAAIRQFHAQWQQEVTAWRAAAAVARAPSDAGRAQADNFETLRKRLVNYQIGNYDIWHVPAADAREMLGLRDLGTDALLPALREVPVRRDRDEIIPGAPQFVGGDHVAHNGHFRPKAYDTLLLQAPPLKEGIWTNRYPGTSSKFHASTCHVSGVPPIAEATRGYNAFLADAGLPPSNIQMLRWYADGGKHLGWHSDEVRDLHTLGLIAVLRTGRRTFQVRDKKTGRVIFDRMLEPFDLVVMTAHGSNLLTEHCVPKEDGETAAAGSVTFRTSTRRIPQDDLRKRQQSRRREATLFGPPATPPGPKKRATSGHAPRASKSARTGPGADGLAAGPSGPVDTDRETRRLAAWIHACGEALAAKLGHAQGAAHEGTEAFTKDPDWATCQRCEVNTRLDGVSRALVYEARGDPEAVALQRAWATRVLLNRRGLLADAGARYASAVGRGLYEGPLDEGALLATLGGKLDNAYPRFRRCLWLGEARAQGHTGGHDQRRMFASTWARLRCEGAFERAIAELEGGAPLGCVLRRTLRVHSEFVAMVLARDLAVLLPGLVSQAAVDACTVVGGGAAPVLQACVGSAGGSSDRARLEHLHARLLELLDPALLRRVAPQGWTLDLTEHACCELRRWDTRRAAGRLHRTRPDGGTQRQQERAEELRATWSLMGFTAPPPLVASCATSF